METWIETWRQDYLSYQGLQTGDPISSHSWRVQMPIRLKALTELLPVPKLPNHIQRVWLIPHRELHLFPLHTLFPKYPSIYLPSIQTMRRPLSNSIAPFQALSLESFHEELPWVNLQGLILGINFESTKRVVVKDHLPENKNILEQLPQHLSYGNTFHYSGHGIHNFNKPTLSGLQLTQDKIWTVGQIFKTDLKKYQRAIQCACEIASAETANIIADYVGIGSAMLGAGVGCVISPLWRVEEMPASLFVLEFYRRLQLDNQDEASTLLATSEWLSQLTNADICDLLSGYLDLFSSNDDYLEEELFLSKWLRLISEQPPQERPYSHPFYTSAFICQGTPKSI